MSVAAPVVRPGDLPSDDSPFDDMPQLVGLLRELIPVKLHIDDLTYTMTGTTAQLLGLLGQVLTKVRLLLQARRICERLSALRPEGELRNRTAHGRWF